MTLSIIFGYLNYFLWLYDSGATNPEYIVTADDVDKIIAVECIPMDDQGHQVSMQLIFYNARF